MKNFRDLVVWQKAHELTLKIYAQTREFPTHEIYNLTIQLRRAAASIPTNIAEGCGRNTEPDFARFIDIAMGSAKETEYLLILATDLSYLPTAASQECLDLADEVQRMLAALNRQLRSKRR